MINEIKNRVKYIRYTLRHRVAFRVVERELCGKVSLRGYMHDLDKVVLYVIFGKKLASKIHRRYARHHERSAKTYEE